MSENYKLGKLTNNVPLYDFDSITRKDLKKMKTSVLDHYLIERKRNHARRCGLNLGEINYYTVSTPKEGLKDVKANVEVTPDKDFKKELNKGEDSIVEFRVIEEKGNKYSKINKAKWQVGEVPEDRVLLAKEEFINAYKSMQESNHAAGLPYSFNNYFDYPIFINDKIDYRTKTVKANIANYIDYLVSKYTKEGLKVCLIETLGTDDEYIIDDIFPMFYIDNKDAVEECYREHITWSIKKLFNVAKLGGHYRVSPNVKINDKAIQEKY